MGVKKIFAGIGAVLVFGACTGDEQPLQRADGPEQGISTEEPWMVASLSDTCRWTAAPSPDGEITFTKEGGLHSVAPDGVVRCLKDGTESHSLAWGPTGDRVLVYGKAEAGKREAIVPGDVREETWSRPTGRAVVYISHDFASLLKVEVGKKRVRDISFLAEHHDVTYHPAGTHLAVSGVAEDGSYGLYLADNEGNDPQLLARGEKAEFISQLSFSHGGRKLYFTADHGDEFHLHELVLVPGRRAGSTDDDVHETRLRTLLESSKAINSVTVSPFSRALAFEVDCRVHVMGMAEPEEAGSTQPRPTQGQPARPIGWMPDGGLVYLTFPRCDESTGDLYLLEAQQLRARKVVQDVGAAAVRSELPPPPKPPEPADEVVA